MLKYKDVYNMQKTAAQVSAPVATATYPAIRKPSKPSTGKFTGKSGFFRESGTVTKYDPYSIVRDRLSSIYNGKYKVTSPSQLNRKRRIAQMSVALAQRVKSMFGIKPGKYGPSTVEQFISSPIK